MIFGLLGKNISYSYSKQIHEFVFNYYNLDHKYFLFDVNEDELDNFFQDFKDGKIKGINVTIPYKERVLKYLDELDNSAKILGNVNTIINNNGKLKGYNTDYLGFDYLLNYYNIVPKKDDYVYILGTGGAAKTCRAVCLKYTNNIKLVSRNLYLDNVINYDNLYDKKIDYLINATPLGDRNHLGEMLVKPNVVVNSNIVIDLIYNPCKTHLLMCAKNGYNGLVMLISQALEADKLFLDIDIDKNLYKRVGELFE